MRLETLVDQKAGSESSRNGETGSSTSSTPVTIDTTRGNNGVTSTTLHSDLLDFNVIPVQPKPASKCPLFACFYSEFDIKKGPVISFQSPKGFMDQDINMPQERIHQLLSNAFEEMGRRGEATTTSTSTAGEACTTEMNTDMDDTQSRGEEFNKNHKRQGSTVSSSSSTGKTSLKEKTRRPAVSKMNSNNHEPAPSSASTPTSGLSIFDSTSEYIITGTELTSKIISLSTHSWHVMTRPTLISNARYERNALLFSVGFLLRRDADPSPFRPLLSKVAVTLQAMEEESGFLTKADQRPKLQLLLDRILLSLNSVDCECNLFLGPSNSLHLKIYQPPKPEASPVHAYQVPILLRRDLQLQMYDWDLAINWVILHVDGVATAQQISRKADVDLEMVLACLRVLKHHGIIALVTQFNYANRYEFTSKATGLLAGKNPKLLQEALDYILKRSSSDGNSQSTSALPVGIASSPIQNNHEGFASPESGFDGRALSPLTFSRHNNNIMEGGIISSSYPPRAQLSFSQRSGRFVFAALSNSSVGKEACSPAMKAKSDQQSRRYKTGIAELFCACTRNLSFGDLWVALTLPSQGPESSSSEDLMIENRSSQQQYGGMLHTSEFMMESLSPSQSYHIDTLRRKEHQSDQRMNEHSTTTATMMNWDEFFDNIDHRCFLTFGLIHKLVVRIHAYPCFPYPFPPPSPDLKNSSTFTSSSTDLSIAAAKTPSVTDGKTKSTSTNNSVMTLDEYYLARTAASLMDGTRIDDEVSCSLEQPLKRLVHLVERYGKQPVLLLYAEKETSQ